MDSIIVAIILSLVLGIPFLLIMRILWYAGSNLRDKKKNKDNIS